MVIINYVAVAAVILALGYGLYKGSGTIIFAGIIITLGGVLIHFVGLPFQGGNPYVLGISQTAAMFVFCAGAFPLGKALNAIFPISFEPFDFLPGAIFGFATAFIAVHFLLIFTLTALTASPNKDSLEKSFAVRHFVNYQFWHTFASTFVDRYDSRPSDMPEE